MQATHEQWRQIPGWDGYEVSDLGQVRSYKRARLGQPPRMLAQARSVFGYPTVGLHDGTRGHTKLVYQLVMLAFVGPPPPGMEVRHLDGDVLNSRLSNLRYGTRSENILDEVAHGTHIHARKTECKHGHPFTRANTYLTGRGTRRCRACRAECERRRRAKQVVG